MPRNVIVAQSGGPTPVINNSLRGVIEACRDYPDVFGTVYGGWHGIEGVLKEELLDLSSQDAREIALLRATPAAGSIGTCRYKLKSGQQEGCATGQLPFVIGWRKGHWARFKMADEWPSSAGCHIRKQFEARCRGNLSMGASRR